MRALETCSQCRVSLVTIMAGRYVQNTNRDRDDNNFQSLVVIEFAHGLSAQTVEWILQKITDGQAVGGAELLACSAWDQNIGVNTLGNRSLSLLLRNKGAVSYGVNYLF